MSERMESALTPSESVESVLTPVKVIIYRLAKVRAIHRQLLQEVEATRDPAHIRRALEATNAQLDGVIALLKALPE